MKTSDLKSPLPCGHIQSWNLATPTTALVPNCISVAVPLDQSVTWRGGRRAISATDSPPLYHRPGIILLYPNLHHTHARTHARTHVRTYVRMHARTRAHTHTRQTQTKVRNVLIRDMLFADDAAVASHTQEELQSLMDCFSQACKDFGLTISLKKTNVMGHDTETPPVITTDDSMMSPVQLHRLHHH